MTREEPPSCAHEWAADELAFSRNCQRCGAFKPEPELPTAVLVWCVGWLAACAVVGGAVSSLCNALVGAIP